MLSELSDVEQQLAIILLQSVNRISHYTYGEISEMVNPPINPHTQLPTYLGNISKLCYELGLPLLSAKVINKDTHIAGEGFYNIYCKLNAEIKKLEPLSVWKDELLKIQLCDEWFKLSDYLGANIEILVSPRLRQQIYPDDINLKILKDGAVKTITVNAFERNPIARQRCIEKYKSKCYICGFDFAKKYGIEFSGKIHVHHIIPLHELKVEYVIDPIKDLRPVCPNCHMILHSKKNGTYTIEEVKAMLINND